MQRFTEILYTIRMMSGFKLKGMFRYMFSSLNDVKGCIVITRQTILMSSVFIYSFGGIYEIKTRFDKRELNSCQPLTSLYVEFRLVQPDDLYDLYGWGVGQSPQRKL
jgi:hypothetical protein